MSWNVRDQRVLIEKVKCQIDRVISTMPGFNNSFPGALSGR